MGSDENGRDYSVKMVKVSDPPPLLLAPAKPRCCQGLTKFCEGTIPSAPALEADYFVMSSAVGKPNERKTCTRVGLVTEAPTGIPLPTSAGHATDSPGDILVRAILSAVQARSACPRRFRSKTEKYKTLLEPLAIMPRLLRFEVVKAIPSIEEGERCPVRDDARAQTHLPADNGISLVALRRIIRIGTSL